MNHPCRWNPVKCPFFCFTIIFPVQLWICKGLISIRSQYSMHLSDHSTLNVPSVVILIYKQSIPLGMLFSERIVCIAKVKRCSNRRGVSMVLRKAFIDKANCGVACFFRFSLFLSSSSLFFSPLLLLNTSPPNPKWWTHYSTQSLPCSKKRLPLLLS